MILKVINATTKTIIFREEVVVTDGVPYITKNELGNGLVCKVSKASLVGSKVSFVVKQVPAPFDSEYRLAPFHQVEIQQVASKAKLNKDDFVRLAKEIVNQRKCAEV